MTQGELLRLEQRAGVVPASQLARSPLNGNASSGATAAADPASAAAQDPPADTSPEVAMTTGDAAADDDEMPHARGPDEIGAADTGPQIGSGGQPFVAGAAVELQAIDVEAAVGRKAPDHPASSSAAVDGVARVPEQPADPTRSTTPKREAEEAPSAAGLPAKKLKEDGDHPAAAAAVDESKEGGKKGAEDQPEKADAEGDIVLSDGPKEDGDSASSAQAAPDAVAAAGPAKSEDAT